VSSAAPAMLLVLTVGCVAANVVIAAADLRRAAFVVANSTEVGVRPAFLPLLAALKAAGAGGLVLGLAGVGSVGVAAALGLVTFYLCAVGAHLRASVFHNIAFPLFFLVLALGAAGFFLLGRA
jgi:hypothetical protein